MTVEAEGDLGKSAPILEHLNELRIRFSWALAGLVIGTIATAIFTEQMLGILTGPYCRFFANNATASECTQQLIALRPTEALETYFRIAITMGAVVSMPFMLIQLWIFIAPGLHKHERRYAYIFVPAATGLFVTGVAFAWFILIPPAMGFLVTLLSDSISSQWQLEPYIDFVTSFLFWLGVSFEMPLIFYFLARFGIVTHTVLREQWRFAIVGIAILAAIITPSVDPVTMLLTMAPLTVLYIFSIILARVGTKQFQAI